MAGTSSRQPATRGLGSPPVRRRRRRRRDEQRPRDPYRPRARQGPAAGTPTPRSGEPGGTVLAEAEQWRPAAAVVGWAAGCDCGWRGGPWTRVSSPQAADPAARLPAVDASYADLDDDAKRHVIDDWRRHIAPFQHLEQLTDAAGRSAAAAAELDDAVRTARRSGASWADIGRATAMSRPSANERWSNRS